MTIDTTITNPTGDMRRSHLTDLMEKLQREGCGWPAIRAAVHSENRETCKPSLEPEEVDALLKMPSAPKPTPQAPQGGPTLNGKQLSECTTDELAAAVQTLLNENAGLKQRARAALVALGGL